MKQSNGFIQEGMATAETEATATSEKVEVNNVSSFAPEVEFSLAPIKPKGVPKFKLTDLYRFRLKCCIFLHFCLFLVILSKLSEDILDRMDIFILQIEELFIPKPLLVEYVYASSILFSVIALRALSSTKTLGSLKSYAAGIVVFGISPLLAVAIYFFNDMLEYIDKNNEAEIEKWQGIPLALFWYGFILIALQVHFFSLYFAAKLIKIWRTKMKKF